MSLIKKLSSWEDSNSLANRMRSRRNEAFRQLLPRLRRPLRIIDVGGTPVFWALRGWPDAFPDAFLTIVNVMDQRATDEKMSCVRGDATNLQEFSDASFDVAFSNSVIEHVGAMREQAQMAAEVRRVARAFWVQTPNYWFPVEPHFLFPGWQWLPESLRVAILQRTSVGWNGRCPDRQKALEVVRNAQLLSRKDLRRLFPGATLMPERFCGLVKSWVAIGGLIPEHAGASTRQEAGDSFEKAWNPLSSRSQGRE